MAHNVAGQFGLHHEIILTDELEPPEYRANPPIAATTASTSSTRG